MSIQVLLLTRFGSLGEELFFFSLALCYHKPSVVSDRDYFSLKCNQLLFLEDMNKYYVFIYLTFYKHSQHCSRTDYH